MQGVTLNITSADVLYLDKILLADDGRIKLLPYTVYKDIPSVHLMAWGTWRARYSFPTIEMIEWIKDKIGDRKAIEIGSGNGDLGFHLDIYSQNR